ncbi:craniofacial development protein 1 [Drosophila innubila]|uniref:craniofacial development protein 1 n=1 Tax=Drosophila innubila TaxID=198719 RepID=UPI00148B3E01|nr:craniofacial development protein 1 [Drosophila innubila]
MNKEQDYASDSDESDEDFCPENVNEEDDSGEEEDDESESEEDDDAEAGKKVTKAAKGKKKDKVKDKRKSIETEITARSTRQTEVKQNGREAAEKDELESDEEVDKSRSDALWADFLGDVGAESKPTATKPKERQPSPVKPTEKIKPKSPVATSDHVTEMLDSRAKSSPSSTSSAKENQEQSATVSLKTGASPRGVFGAAKRPANGGGTGSGSGGAGGGLGSLLNQLGKKKKLSVLEKSQQDWKSFKNDEGIDEELRTHNKGKDGYLERQDFLQRTDVRQFEIEKNLRQTRRQN